jgi:UDP-N-acetylmuramoyl-tripeptide--D-alanyl-D-alanine ligase
VGGREARAALVIDMTVAQVAQAIGATVEGDGDLSARVLDVVTDSRAVRPGSLFLAIPGARVDGHDYVATAAAAGAVAAVTQRGLPGVGATLVVEDPVAALGRLARHVVDGARGGALQVLGITGSQGKTSTKDLLAQILERADATVAALGNLNNELGVPLTAVRVSEATRYLVVEMGARGIGHVAYLCQLTPPDVGVVLNVGHAHVGEFGGQAAIAVAKGELVEALGPAGRAVLNADDPLVWAMRERTQASVTAFSVRGRPDAAAAVWATEIHSDELSRCRFRLHVGGDGGDGQVEDQAEVRLQLVGEHHVANAVAAAAAALAVGVDLDRVAAALSGARLRSGSRMEVHERADDVVVVNDAYNANPDSMRAAVGTLAVIGRARRVRWPQSRTWAVLGDMLELGEGAVGDHEALGALVAEQGIDRLVAVGDFAEALARGALAAGMTHDQVLTRADKSGVADLVRGRLSVGDAILVKASRGLALDTVAEEIWTSPVPAEPSRSAAARASDRAAEMGDPA